MFHFTTRIILTTFCLCSFSFGYPPSRKIGAEETETTNSTISDTPRNRYHHHHHHHHRYHQHDSGTGGFRKSNVDGLNTAVFVPRFPVSAEAEKDSKTEENTPKDRFDRPAIRNDKPNQGEKIDLDIGIDDTDQSFVQKPIGNLPIDDQHNHEELKPTKDNFSPDYNQNDKTSSEQEYNKQPSSVDSSILKPFPNSNGEERTPYDQDESNKRQDAPKDSEISFETPGNRDEEISYGANDETKPNLPNYSKDSSDSKTPIYESVRPLTPGFRTPQGSFQPTRNNEGDAKYQPEINNQGQVNRHPFPVPQRPVSHQPNLPDINDYKPNRPIVPDISYGVNPSGHSDVPSSLPADINPQNPGVVPFYSPDGPFKNINTERPLIPQPTRDSYQPDHKTEQKPEFPFVPDHKINQKPEVNVAPVYPDLKELCQTLNLKRFVALMDRAGMNNVFGGTESVTIFAPNDEAFSRLPVHVNYRMTRDKDFLRTILSYHIVNGVHLSKQMEGTDQGFYQTKSPGGLRMFMKNVKGKPYVNGLPIQTPDQQAKNGVVQVLDQVFYPVPSKTMSEMLQSTGTFLRFYTLALEIGLFDKELAGTEQYTIFAPTDEAFAKLPRKTLEWISFDKQALKELLMKHVVRGMHFMTDDEDTLTTMGNGQLKIQHLKNQCSVNDVPVGTSDRMTQNGVLHAIPEVLFSKDLKPREDFQRPSLKRIYFSTR